MRAQASFLLLASLRIAIDDGWLPLYSPEKAPAIASLLAQYDKFAAHLHKSRVAAVEEKLWKTPYIVSLRSFASPALQSPTCASSRLLVCDLPCHRRLQYLPYRELHTHRRLSPPDLPSATPQHHFGHHLLLRTGLIAAPEALYRSLPPDGLHSGNVDKWFASEQVQAWYKTRGISQGEDGINMWGRTNCYGSNARGISFDKRDVFLGRRAEVFAAVQGLPFCDALTALHAAALPVFSVGSISAYLVVGGCSRSRLYSADFRPSEARLIRLSSQPTSLSPASSRYRQRMIWCAASPT